MNNNASQGRPPVSEGEELDVYIESLGEKGDGICKVKGFVIFVNGTSKGDEIRIRVTKVLEKVGFAEKIGPAQSDVKPKHTPHQRSMPRPKKKEEPKEKIIVDDETGVEKITGADFEAEYDPNKDSEDF